MVYKNKYTFKHKKNIFKTDINHVYYLIFNSLRIYPQDQNTGGFFVAVFEKVKPMTVADRMSIAKDNGKSLSNTEIQSEEAKDESLVKSINEEVSTPLSTEEKESAEKESTADDENKDTSSVPTKRNSESANEESTNKNKKVKKDVDKMKEAPFDLMAVDNPDLLEIK